MSVSQPYTSLFDAVAGALVGQALSGPFTYAQIDIIEDDIMHELEASEQLIGRIATNKPIALIADGGSEFPEDAGGGNEYTEEQIVKVFYGVMTPNAELSLKGHDSGTPYWGEFQVRRWILQQLALHTFDVTGFTYGLIPSARTVVRIRPDQRPIGKVMRCQEFRTRYIHTATT